jgi:hypothetical protein
MPAIKAILVLLLVCFAVSAQAESYRDLQGRFVFDVPNGWRVSPLGAQGVSVSDGASSYLNVVNVPGGGTEPNRIKAITDQIGSQWKNFTQGENGNATVSGQNGFYVFFDGVNPKGVQATMRVTGAAFGADAYILIMAASAADFGRVSAGFKQIEHSFAVSSGAAPTQSSTAPTESLPGHVAPDGFQSLDEPQGGRILYGSLGGPSSGQAAFKAGIGRLRGYFDASPDLQSGVDGKDGAVSLVMFSATLKGAPVTGLAVATSDGAGGSRVGFLFDLTDRFAQTLGPMQQHLKNITLASLQSARPAASGSQSGGFDLERIKEAAKSVPLTEVKFPDQTATVGIAEGYKIQNMQMGSFSAIGPDGAFVNSGGFFGMVDPNGTVYQSWKRLMAMTPNLHSDYPGALVSYIDDPAEAWVVARKFSAQQNHQPDPQVRLESKDPLQLPPGPLPHSRHGNVGRQAGDVLRHGHLQPAVAGGLLDDFGESAARADAAGRYRHAGALGHGAFAAHRSGQAFRHGDGAEPADVRADEQNHEGSA